MRALKAPLLRGQNQWVFKGEKLIILKQSGPRSKKNRIDEVLVLVALFFLC